jgi:hypothetical protein
MRPSAVRAVAALAIAFNAAPVTSGPSAAEPYSFRGVALGTSLADLRRLRYPEAPSARILCSHDAEVRDIRPTEDFVAAGPEAEAGVRVCSAFVFGHVIGPTTSGLQPEWMPARVKIGNIEVSPAFWFVPGPDGRAETSGRLYRISMRSNTAFWDETLAAFTRRYGKPTSVEKGSFPVYRVGLVENETVTWANPESTIRLVKRAGRISRMTIVYEHSQLAPVRSGTAVSPAQPGEPGRVPGNPG